jgi:hypothetical protein
MAQLTAYFGWFILWLVLRLRILRRYLLPKRRNVSDMAQLTAYFGWFLLWFFLRFRNLRLYLLPKRRNFSDMAQLAACLSVCCLAYSLTLKMKAICSSETIGLFFSFIISGVGLSPLGTAATLAYCTSPR